MRNFLLSLFVASAAIGVLDCAAFGQVPTASPAQPDIDVRKALIENIQKSPQLPAGDRQVVVSSEDDVRAVMTGPIIWSKPEVSIPDEAKATGLGGMVRVLVTVGQTGVVLDAKVVGPDSVCPTVTRPDVLAIRRAAEEAARRTTFGPFQGDREPQEKMATLVFEFPRVKPEQNETRNISGGILNGKAVELVKPEYPPAARAVRAAGDVSVKVVIDTDGSVFSADASSGHPLLRHVSEVAACDSRFSQTFLSGTPVSISGVIVYNFVP